MSATSTIRQRPHLTPIGGDPTNVSPAWLRTAACYATIALILFGPIAFGAVETWAMFILQAGSVTVFMLWLGSVMLDQKPVVEFQAIHIPPIIFAAIVLFQFLWNRSGYRHETVTDFMNYVAYGLIFLIATDLFRK